jgi:NNP family nitrate/nitrite transporter-like MFS transporter
VKKYDSLRGKALLLLLFFWFVWFMTFTARAIFSPVLPLLEDEFSVTHAKAASIFTVSGIGYALAVFFSGTFSRLLGPRNAILFATAVSGLMLLLIPFVKVFELYYVLTFIMGVSLGAYIPSAIPFITAYYSEDVWGRAIAVHGSAPSVAVFLTPFIALGILSFLPWRGVFVLPGLAFLLCAAVFFFISRDTTLGKGKDVFLSSLLKSKAIWIMGIVSLFSAGANIGLYYIIPLYLVKELYLPMDYANSIFGVSRLGGAIITIVAGFFVDRISLKKVCFCLAFATGILTTLLTLAGPRWIGLFLFLQASISPVFFPFAYVAVAKLFNQEQRGQAAGFVITIGMIGTGLVPYFLGLSGDLASFRIGIFLLGICTALSSGLLWFLKELK